MKKGFNQKLKRDLNFEKVVYQLDKAYPLLIRRPYIKRLEEKLKVKCQDAYRDLLAIKDLEHRGSITSVIAPYIHRSGDGKWIYQAAITIAYYHKDSRYYYYPYLIGDKSYGAYLSGIYNVINHVINTGTPMAININSIFHLLNDRFKGKFIWNLNLFTPSIKS